MTSRPKHSVAGIGRAFALSWLAVTLSTVAHLCAGGAAPPVPTSLAVGFALALVGLPFCRSAFRLSTAGPLLLVQQLLVHLTLGIMGTGHGATRPTGRLAASLEDPHAAHPSPSHGAPTGSGEHATTAGHALLPSPDMLVAHVAAAVLVSLLLAFAEGDLRRLLDLTRTRTRVGLTLASLLAPLATGLSLTVDTRALLRALLRDTAPEDLPAPVRSRDLWRSPAPCRRGPPALRAA